MKKQDNIDERLERITEELKKTVKDAENDEQNVLIDETGESPIPGDSASEKEQAQVRKLNKALGTNRGIETMFRSAYRVQMDLTGLADNKANMMISINGIIISIIIAAVAPKLDANPWLLVPSTLFLLGTLISIIYAILAARPRLKNKPISLGDLRHSEGNILFFGDFSYLDEAEFLEGMVELMRDKTVVYETMIRNIYGLGAVLHKKFALLQMAYTSFMIALILGVASFITVFVWILLHAT
jgi:hypothetical protein